MERISGCTFDGANASGYFAYIETYGIAYGNTINGGSGNQELFFIRGRTDSWQTAHTMGGANNVFIENNTFTGEGYVCDANSNARVVVRYNTIVGGIKIDGHGKASNSPPRGVRHMEVYGNHFSASGYAPLIEIRGGTGRFFKNTAVDTTGWFFLTDYGCTADVWANFGYTYQTPDDYPIDDQLGVGQDPKVAGSAPAYVFGNLKNGTPWAIEPKDIPAGAITEYGASFTMLGDIIVADRDYFISVPAFDGSSGVGEGTKTAMLAITPTLTGVGYWVTDEGSWHADNPGASGQLYVWNGSAWELDYTPYTYPHPLRDDGEPTVPTHNRVRLWRTGGRYSARLTIR